METLLTLFTLVILIILLRTPFLMSSWVIIRGPRVGRAIKELGHWPNDELMFGFIRFPDNAPLPLGAWAYGTLVIFISWWFRILLFITLMAGLIGGALKLLYPDRW
jgi:hypothetical protein